MTRFLLCLSILLAACTARQSAPTSSNIEHTGYTLAYDGKTRNASWVYERLTPASLEGTADRSRCEFVEDPLIPSPFRATPLDYKGSGFDRGHLRPAANAKSSPIAMQDTFYLSNVCPQVPQLNRGYWSQLEKYVRTRAMQYQVLHVYTGPLYLPHTEADGKRYVKYEVIGANDVAVPTHFFKVLIGEKTNGGRDIEAYIVPNSVLPKDADHSTYRSSLEKVQKAAGTFFLAHTE
ncbi:MAG: DNA/RNA non-specific endonuclease [Verrucomicrobia bacterium]|nr:DNA/RNA non-specific endonuclease [Verrucomicrobiota bacterium]